MVEEAHLEVAHSRSRDGFRYDKESPCFQVRDGPRKVIGFITHMVRSHAVVAQDFRDRGLAARRLQQFETGHPLLFQKADVHVLDGIVYRRSSRVPPPKCL